MLHRLIVPMTTFTRVPDVAEDPFGTPGPVPRGPAHDRDHCPRHRVHPRRCPHPRRHGEPVPASRHPILVTCRVLRDDHGAALAIE